MNFSRLHLIKAMLLCSCVFAFNASAQTFLNTIGGVDDLASGVYFVRANGISKMLIKK